MFAGPAQAAAPESENPVVMETLTVESAKTHTLFMGADISVSLGDDLYPVKDVVGASWVLAIGGQEKLVSTKDAETHLRITPNLKLAEGSAKIAGFSRVQSYSFANDPRVILTKRLTRSGMTTAMLEGVASDNQASLDTVGNSALGGAQIAADSDKQFGDAALMNMAKVGYKSTLAGKTAAGGHGAGGADQGPAIRYAAEQLDAAEQNTRSETESIGQPVTLGLDAMNVDFTISSAKALYNPYVVTMTRYHPKGAKPGIVKNHIFAEALNPIDSHPQHVHFVEEGFPYNYELVDFQFHIYDRGVEVATDISSNRVELTREEAFEYVKFEYVDAHKGATLPAVPAMGRLPAELQTRLASGQYTNSVYVEVSPDGLAVGSFTDRSCTRKIDDVFLESVVKNIRFKPALAAGKPVPGVAELNLSKLQI
jgi:hypothetical protein